MLKTLLKPFEFVQERTLLLFGCCCLLITSIVQLFTLSRTISILKMADYIEYPQWWQVSLDAIISTLLMTVVLFAFGKIVNRKTRLIDIFNTVLIARIPLSLIVFSDINGFLTLKTQALLSVVNNPEAMAEQMGDITFITIIGIFGILALVLFAYYIYQGFKTATHSKKIQHIIVLIILVLITDTLTRYVTTLY